LVAARAGRLDEAVVAVSPARSNPSR
jgi:hypothetical protein